MIFEEKAELPKNRKDFNPLPVGYLPADKFIMQAANDSADMKSARHGQPQEKENNSDYGIEYYPFENFFNGKW